LHEAAAPQRARADSRVGAPLYVVDFASGGIAPAGDNPNNPSHPLDALAGTGIFDATEAAVAARTKRGGAGRGAE
jgi:hypothetical protein